MNSHKVKAFTIMEVVITMMISAILMVIICLIYLVISSSYNVFKGKNEELNTINTLDELLKKDFREGRYIAGDQNIMTITRGKDSITYQWDKAYVVRSDAGVVDTFKVNTAGRSVSFEQYPFESTNNILNTIDELKLDLVYKRDTLHYHYQADYSSSDLLNQDKHGID